MKYFYHLITCLLPAVSFGQLILGGNNPQDIVTQVLSGSGVNISNITYTGSSEAISYFSANTQNMSFHSGLLITTGYRNLAMGPNNDSKSRIDNGYPGSILVDGLASSQSHNAAILAFDLIPSGDTLKIRYIFGSEEYPEYVGNSYTDVFAIFMEGPGIPGSQNIAKLPNGDPITVNKVNNGNPGGTGSGIPACAATNPQYFVDNGNGNQAPYNSSNTYLQFDGLTVPLTAKRAVIPGQTYHIIIVIAEGGDGIFDSGAFIEEGGITASTGENNLNNFVNVIYNPMDQQATVKITEYQGSLTYSVIDLSGKTMTQSKITETTTIDLSNYTSGMYLIRITGSNGQIIKKVIR